MTKRSFAIVVLVPWGLFGGAAVMAAACSPGDLGGEDASSSSTGNNSSSSGGVVPIDGGLPFDGDTPIQGVDGGVMTALPPLPELTNVTGILREDSTGIDFDPVDGALDYRVYPLPKDGDITVNADGSTTIKNAIYRCAGMRQTLDNKNTVNQNDPNLHCWDNCQYVSTTTIDPDPTKNTLGHVWMTGGADRAPVYAVGLYPEGDEVGWRESRFKIYTTDATQQQTLIGQGGRDDGVVFYVPKAASASTHTVYSSQLLGEIAGQARKTYDQYYFNADKMGDHTMDTTPPAPAFEVLTTAAAGTEPLMAAQYMTEAGHTELSPGTDRFQRSAYQGDGPLWHLEWAGITAPTTLVVEALDEGCPFQGFLSPTHLAAPPHQTFYTLDELQKASPTGEVFINGEYAATNVPKAVARSFIDVAPQPHVPADWDWYQGFEDDTALSPAKAVPGCTDSDCGRWQTPAFDISMYRIDEPNNVPVFTYGQFLGQMWTAFDDAGSDVTGKIRFTALQKATIDPDPTKFLHVTMSVDIVTTDRRYPQLILSDQPAPVQENFANPAANSLLIQPIEGPSMRIEAQAIHGLFNGNGTGIAEPWDVNNQAPHSILVDYDNWSDPPSGITYTDDMPSPGYNTSQPPAEPPTEHAGMDRITRFDVFASSQRLYLFLDDKPAGCTLFPSGDFSLKGAVTVTFGDVLYHEGATDEEVCSQTAPYGFMHLHQCTETKRHFDDLGFKSGVEAPAWNEKLFPCFPYGATVMN